MDWIFHISHSRRYFLSVPANSFLDLRATREIAFFVALRFSALPRYKIASVIAHPSINSSTNLENRPSLLSNNSLSGTRKIFASKNNLQLVLAEHYLELT